MMCKIPFKCLSDFCWPFAFAATVRFARQEGTVLGTNFVGAGYRLPSRATGETEAYLLYLRSVCNP